MGDASSVDQNSWDDEHIEEDVVEFVAGDCNVVAHRADKIIFDFLFCEVLHQFIEKKEEDVGEDCIDHCIGRSQGVF